MELRLYKNVECTVEAEKDVQFGEVQVGTSGIVRLWLKNDSYGLLRKIKVNCSDENVKVQHPEVLKPKEVGEVVFTWSPPLEMRRGLHAEIAVSGEETYE